MGEIIYIITEDEKKLTTESGLKIIKEIQRIAAYGFKKGKEIFYKLSKKLNYQQGKETSFPFGKSKDYPKGKEILYPIGKKRY